MSAAVDRMLANWPALSSLYLKDARTALVRKHQFESWECYALACLARAHYTVGSTLMLEDRESDCATLTRVLYEHVIAFAWLMIDPAHHYQRLVSWEKKERLKVVKGLARFIPGAPSEAEATANLMTLGLDLAVPAAPETFDRAVQAQEFWQSRDTGCEFCFARNYECLFRTYSSYVHPTTAGLMQFFDPDPAGDPARPVRRHTGQIPAEAMLMFSDMLIVSAHSLGWPDRRQITRTLSNGVQHENRRGENGE